MEIKLKRVYEPAEDSDGFRVFVDRLWPRGLSHASFHYDLWEKSLAPSADLRAWFHVDPEARSAEFERRYDAELRDNPEFRPFVRSLSAHRVVTLLYASRDKAENNAVVLRDAILDATAGK